MFYLTIAGVVGVGRAVKGRLLRVGAGRRVGTTVVGGLGSDVWFAL